MAKVNPADWFHVANHTDAVTGAHSQILRSAHNMGGNKAFRQCMAEGLRGHGGDARGVRVAFASRAKQCAGTRRGR